MKITEDIQKIKRKKYVKKKAVNQKWFIAFYAVWIIRINRCTHNAPHTYAIITIRLFERREAFPTSSVQSTKRLRS